MQRGKNCETYINTKSSYSMNISSNVEILLWLRLIIMEPGSTNHQAITSVVENGYLKYYRYGDGRKCSYHFLGTQSSRVKTTKLVTDFQLT